MDSIVEKLAEIEKTAEAIVEHAEAQKYEVEREIQAKRDAFGNEHQGRGGENPGRGEGADGSGAGGAEAEKPLCY